MKVFEPFRLDTTNHCLWHGEDRASLSPKAFDVLRYLVDHAGRLVTHQEILEALWPQTYVNQEGIRKYILEIRKILGDRPNQSSFIETVPKRGYRFLAKVSEESTVPPRPVGTESQGNVVGREAALAELAVHLENARTGRREVVFVTGEAGIGKTTLVDVFQQDALSHSSIRIARGQCIEGFGGKEAYYPMLEAVGSLIRNGEDAAWVEMLATRAPAWLIQFPTLVKAGQRELLQRETLGSTRERMVREICEVLEGMSAQTPLAVILEDLHWADHCTLDLISAFARRREPAKVLMIGTYRPVDVVLSQSPLKGLKQDLLVRNLCREIAIERLQESDVAEYLSKEFAPHSFPAELAALIHHNSGGNPLFMAAIVRDIVKKGLIAQDRGTWTLAAPLHEVYPGIPESLRQLLDIQFEQLSGEERLILETCSVTSERFSVWAAALLLDRSPELIEEVCEGLARRRQFIRFAGIHQTASGAESPHYEFKHSLYRQALYRRLSTSNRSKLHRSLGETLIPLCDAGRREYASELALHLEEGRDYERAARYWKLAAENATRRFSHRGCIQILRHALEIVEALTSGTRHELEADILQRIGDSHFALGEMSDSAAAYGAAADRAAQAGLQAIQIQALVRLSFPAWYLDSAHGREVLRQVLAVSASLGDPLLAAQTRLAAVSFRLFYDAWREEDAEVCVSAQEMISRLSGSSLVHDVFYLYVQAFQGHYWEALGQVDALCNATGNPTIYALASGAKGLIFLFWGRFGELLRMIRTRRDLIEKDGGDAWSEIVLEAWLRAMCFDYEGVRRLGQTITRSDPEEHAVQPRTVAMLATGYAELLQEKFDEALQCFAHVRESRAASGSFLHWYWRMQAELGTSEARLSAGDLAGAHREADGFLKSALSTAEPNMRALAWELKARVASAEKDFESARTHIDHALAIVDRFDIPVAGWRVHATACDLCGYESTQTAETHRTRARELITQIVDSFDPGEPLRESLLSAAPVRRVFAYVTSA